MINISVRGLPRSTTERSLESIFSTYGKVHSLKLVKDLFSGECKGFATVSMEGHEARAAIAGLNNKDIDGNQLRVSVDDPKRGFKGKRR